MSSVGYHEPMEELSDETRDMHRTIVSLMEELEAVDWYKLHLGLNMQTYLGSRGNIKQPLIGQRAGHTGTPHYEQEENDRRSRAGNSSARNLRIFFA